jgi:DNA polymerase (family 10)
MSYSPNFPAPVRRAAGPSNDQQREAADVLFSIATILDATNGNPYRVRAYRRAARLILREREDLSTRLVMGLDRNPGPELNLPGLGPRLRRKLGELIATGRMEFCIELTSQRAPELEVLMQIRTVGERTALRLVEELGVKTIEDVVEAAEDRRIRTLFGFAAARERQILEGAREVLAGNPKAIAALPPATEDEQPEPPTPISGRLPRPRQIALLDATSTDEELLAAA